MRKCILASGLMLFSSVGCASSQGKKLEEMTKKQQNQGQSQAQPAQQQAQPQDVNQDHGDLIIKSGSGEEILRVTYEGDLYHRKKKIDDKDAIISAFYDVVVSRTNGYANCLNTLMQNMEAKKACAKNTK